MTSLLENYVHINAKSVWMETLVGSCHQTHSFGDIATPTKKEKHRGFCLNNACNEASFYSFYNEGRNDLSDHEPGSLKINKHCRAWQVPPGSKTKIHYSTSDIYQDECIYCKHSLFWTDEYSLITKEQQRNEYRKNREYLGLRVWQALPK